jgi:hypothetical protein
MFHQLVSLSVGGLVTYIFGFSRALSLDRQEHDAADTPVAKSAATVES